MPVPFKIIQLDRPRKLRFGMAAAVEFEQTTGLKLASLDDEITMDTMANLLWIMLKQEDAALTLAETTRLVDEYSTGLIDVTNAVREAITLAFSTGKNG